MARTVIIADDVPFVRKALADILVENHYQIVAEATTGREAMDLYAKYRPDVVTMDIVMPEMSGIEATRAILHMDPNAKVIIVSALGQEHLVSEAIHIGARDFIIKPFSKKDIIRAIDRAFSDDELSGKKGK